MKVSNRIAENAFTIAVLFLSTGALLWRILDLSSVQAIDKGSPFLKMLWAGVYLILAVYEARHLREIAAIVRANLLLFLLVALAFISTAWSQDPAITFQRAIGLAFTTLFGIYFSSRYPIREQLRLIGLVLAATIVLSVLVELLVPGMFPPAELFNAGAWNGLFIQKNEFGRLLALMAVVVMVHTRRSLKAIMLDVAALVALLAVIAKTKSSSALVITIAMVLAVKAFSGLRWKRRTVVALGPAFALLGILLVFLAPLIGPRLAGLMRRDTTLTGRTEVWNLSLSSIAKRPVLGYGYIAFWNGSEEGARIKNLAGWDVPSAHNGYIELALGLGAVGFLVGFGAYCIAIRRAAVYVQNNPGNEAKWPLAFMLFTLLYCTTESVFLVPHSIFWILFSAAVFSVSPPLVRDLRAGEVQETVKSETLCVPAEA